MKFAMVKKNLFRLFNSYTKEHFFKLIIALLLSFAVAGGTASIAWLLDPAIKKIFIEQDKTLLLLIPLAIVAAFTVKGVSLYFARTIFRANSSFSWVAGFLSPCAKVYSPVLTQRKIYKDVADEILFDFVE